MGQLITFPVKQKPEPAPIDAFELGPQSSDTQTLRRMSFGELHDELAYVANHVSSCQFFIRTADIFRRHASHEISQLLGDSAIEKIRFEQADAELLGRSIQREINRRATGDHAA